MEKIRIKKQRICCKTKSLYSISGTHEGIRTSDLSLRRRSLYPAELRGLIHKLRYSTAECSVCQQKSSTHVFTKGTYFFTNLLFSKRINYAIMHRCMTKERSKFR